MKVRCVYNHIDVLLENAVLIQSIFDTYNHIAGYDRNYTSYLTIGKEYVVMGLHFNQEDRIVYFTIIPDAGILVFFPSMLFDIIDARVSKNWEIDIDQENGNTILGHRTLFKDGYSIIDQVLEDQDEEATRQLVEITTNLINEYE